MGMRKNNRDSESHFAEVINLPGSHSQVIPCKDISAKYKALLQDSLAKIGGSFSHVDTEHHEVIESTLETLKAAGIITEKNIISNKEGGFFIRTKEGIVSVREFMTVVLESA